MGQDDKGRKALYLNGIHEEGAETGMKMFKGLSIPTQRPIESMKQLQAQYCNGASCQEIECEDCLFSPRNSKPFAEWEKSKAVEITP